MSTPANLRRLYAVLDAYHEEYWSALGKDELAAIRLVLASLRTQTILGELSAIEIDRISVARLGPRVAPNAGKHSL